MTPPAGDHPPRVARGLLARALPPDVRDAICGDLDEVFQRDCQAHGRSAARRRYWRKTLSFTGRFTVERARESWRSLRAARTSLLDFRLGARMLARYPGLTIIGGLALACAIAVGAAVFAFINQFFSPTIPLPEGERIVAVRLRDAATGSLEHRAAFDFARWRAQVTTIEGLSATRAGDRNLVTPDGVGQPVALAETSASMFPMTGVTPLHGRAIQTADERPGAPAVIVLGHDLWRTRFGGDPAAIGAGVYLGREPATVVGIMPAGFRYPLAQEAWTAIRLGDPADPPRQGPAIRITGRLTPGATLEQARSELAAIGGRTSAAHPETHEHLRPEVRTLADAATDIGRLERAALFSINVFVAMLLVLVSGNVALLMFARAATREGEIVVRSALGASRGRIVAQFLAEALVLGGLAAVAGIAIAGWGLRWGMRAFQSAALADSARLPFWISDRLAPSTVAYAIGLALLASIVAGVVPALKVTRGLQSRLREATAGGGGLKFGGIWTLVIVAQVAITVTFPVTSFLVRRDALQVESVAADFPADRFLAVRLEMDPDVPAAAAPPAPADAFRAAFAARVRQLTERLEQEPDVAGAVVATDFPRMYHSARIVEVDDGGAGPPDPDYGGGYRVSTAGVSDRFFETLDVPILQGRGFTTAEVRGSRPVIVVNQSFVAHVFGGRNPIGRRVRYLREEGSQGAAFDVPPPWLEVVGVVRDLGMGVPPDSTVAGFYAPMATEEAYPARLAVRVRGDAMAFAPTLRAIATSVDPALRLYDIVRLDRVNEGDVRAMAFWFRLTISVSAVALVLSLAGIYAVMSFAVSRRTREIGIRVALGSDRGRIVLAILWRPLVQVALGIAAGAVLTTWLVVMVYQGSMTALHLVIVVAYALGILAICLLACVVPVRRALGVQPTDALRADG